MAKIKLSGITDESVLLNKLPRIPLVICVDMCVKSNETLRSIQREINSFRGTINERADLRNIVDIGIILFDQTVHIARELQLSTVGSAPVVLKRAEGVPDLAKALDACMMMLKRKESDNRNSNISTFRSMVVLFSTGGTSDWERYERMAGICKREDSNQKLTMVPILLEPYAEESAQAAREALQKLNYEGRVLRLMDRAKIDKLFGLINQSIEKLSQSTDNMYMDALKNIKGWDQFK